MADKPSSEIVYGESCQDCGQRRVQLPERLPTMGDDFDWSVRDYDSFRKFMMEELVARFPARNRWTSADMETVLVEVFANALDQLSDMLDRVYGEAFLETARHPDSVRRLLKIIGFDAINDAGIKIDPMDPFGQWKAEKSLTQRWLNAPHLMEQARQAGPREIHQQYRLVTEKDYTQYLRLHPLVKQAHAWSEWAGSWSTIKVALLLENNHQLDELFLEGVDSEEALFQKAKKDLDDFHRKNSLPALDLTKAHSYRSIVNHFIRNYRLSGQAVQLEDGYFVPITISLTVKVSHNYFQSEVHGELVRALGMGVGGYFEPGNHGFGDDLYVSDIFQIAMALDGVEAVCVNRFKRLGKHHPDQSGSGRIVLNGLELAVCDNQPGAPQRGNLHVKMTGGREV